MSGSDFIFCFQDKDNRFWQVDNTGSITINNNPYFLQFAPDGWDNVEISNIRNRKYWGIDRSVSVPLSYVQDAAHILKYIFYNLGIEESVYLVIASQTLDYVPGVSYGYWYKQIYRGEVDLSTYSHAGSKITCTTLEDGIPKYLKANENTVYEFPMNVVDAIVVKGDGINLHEKLNYAEVAALDVSLAFYGTRFYLPTNLLGNDGNSVGILTTSQFLASAGALAAIEASTNCILTNIGTSAVTLTISGVFEFKCTGMTSSPAYAARVQFVTSLMTIADFNTLYHIIDTAAMVVGQTYTQAYSVTVPLQPQEKLFVIGTFFGGVGSDAKIQFTENSKSFIKFITRQLPTNIKAFRPQYLFEQLINKMTGGEISVAKSDYFKLKENIVFTCGNAIRGISFPDGINPTVMKISFAEFFQFWDSYDSVGIIEKGDIINFGSKVNLVDKVNIINLPEPSNLKVTVAKDYLFNEVEIGYPDIKNEIGILNGAQEFNVGFHFSVGLTKSPAKISKISKIKASCYEIELIRVTTLAKDTTDNKADNENYVLEIAAGTGGFQSYYSSTESYSIVMVGSDSVVVITGDFGSTLIIGDEITLNGSVPYLIKNIIVGSGVWNVYLKTNIPIAGSVTSVIFILRNQPYNLNRSLNATATGLTEPTTVFNIGLSPKRMLLNNGQFLRSSMYKADSLNLKYVSSDRNKSLASGGIVEKDNVTLSALGDKFFYPVLFDFDVPAPSNLLELLNTNPLQVFRFPFYGNYYTGIVVKVSIAPSNLKSQNYQLLSTSENDLSKLIEYYGG